jgi:hypothetical protein
MMQFVAQGFATTDGTEFSPYGDGRFLLAGNIQCLGGITINIWKELAIVGPISANPLVQTQTYSYNAWLNGRGNIFRYDSPHPHRPEHHVHQFDVLRGDTVGTITTVQGDAWPTIGEVLVEARNFYYDNFTVLAELEPPAND